MKRTRTEILLISAVVRNWKIKVNNKDLVIKGTAEELALVAIWTITHESSSAAWVHPNFILAAAVNFKIAIAVQVEVSWTDKVAIIGHTLPVVGRNVQTDPGSLWTLEKTAITFLRENGTVEAVPAIVSNKDFLAAFTFSQSIFTPVAFQWRGRGLD